MKTPQKTLLIFTIVAIVCALLVAVVSAEPAAPNGPIIISKTVSPQVIAPDYIGVLTYTITVTNTAAPAIPNAFMEDTLPTLLSFGEWISKPTVGTITQIGDTILWAGPLEAPPTSSMPTQPNVLVFVFTAKLPDPESITLLLTDGKIENAAYAGHIDGTIYIIEDSDSATTYFHRYIFLPLVMRNFVQ